MTRGQRFRLWVDATVAGRMDRVIVINDGKIVAKKTDRDGTMYEVEKT